MGQHRNDGEFWVSAQLDQTPKPGSRRARRMAERAAAQAKQRELREQERLAREALANADTGEFPPIVSQDVPQEHARFAPSGVDSMRIRTPFKATVTPTIPAAEQMNHALVARSAGIHMPTYLPTRRTRMVQGTAFGAAALLIAGLGLGFAIDPTDSHRLAPQAYAASANTLASQQLLLADGETVDMDGETGVAIRYTVVVDGEELTLTTTSGTTVAQALEDAGIELGELDEVSLPLNTRLESNVTITIVRVTTALVSEDFEVEYETVREDDSSLAQGTEKVETEGQNGVGTRTYTVYYRDGEEANWEMTVEAVTTQPVNEVIRVGTRTSSSSSSGGSFTPPANAAPVAPGTSRAIAAEMVAARGWSESEFACLDTLWQRESGWNHLAMNPYSGAYGIPQSLPGSKMASAGADWQTNPATQIAWGLSYISGRYGTPCGALSHSYSVGWY